MYDVLFINEQGIERRLASHPLDRSAAAALARRSAAELRVGRMVADASFWGRRPGCPTVLVVPIHEAA